MELHQPFAQISINAIENGDDAYAEGEPPQQVGGAGAEAAVVNQNTDKDEEEFGG